MCIRDRCLLDAEGIVLAANRAACPLLGAAPDGLSLIHIYVYKRQVLMIAAASPASAARIGGGTLEPVGPTPFVPGVWRAKVRYVHPHSNPDGTYSTYSYICLLYTSRCV